MTARMGRRALLGWTAAGLAGATAPGWIAAAFAGDGDGSFGLPGESPLQAALRAARASGKPVLVIVIPEDEGERHRRGGVWGELLNHGSEEGLARLALCEVVCASNAEVRAMKAIAGVPSIEPFALLIEKMRARPVRVDVGKLQPVDFTMEAMAAYEGLAKARIVRVEAALAKALAPSGAALGWPSREVGERRAARIAALAKDARQRLLLTPPRGTRWASSGGCGLTIEGEDCDVRVACGMARVPEISRRFLYFFSEA